jgi:hypothetical protein
MEIQRNNKQITEGWKLDIFVNLLNKRRKMGRRQKIRTFIANFLLFLRDFYVKLENARAREF